MCFAASRAISLPKSLATVYKVMSIPAEIPEERMIEIIKNQDAYILFFSQFDPHLRVRVLIGVIIKSLHYLVL